MDEERPAKDRRDDARCQLGRGATIRPRISAAVRMPAPIIAESGRRLRLSGPLTARARCGATSPIKAIGPALAVAAPARIITDRQDSAQTGPGRNPSARPISTPIDRAFRSRASASASPPPSTRAAHITRATAMPRPSSVPEPQLRKISSTSSPEFRITKPVAAPRSTESPAPASTRRTGSVPDPCARPRIKTATPASPAPTKPNQTYCVICVRPKADAPRTTAIAAPEFTPRSPGSAKGCASPPA